MIYTWYEVYILVRIMNINSICSTIGGTIVIRTCYQHKKPYIPLFLLTLLGADYYVPPKNSTGYTPSYGYIGGRERKGEDNELEPVL